MKELHSPLLIEEGWTRHQNVRKARPGWSDTTDHPVCAFFGRFAAFFVRAASPPLRGGEYVLLLMLISASLASAQRQFTLNVDTQLVVETVTVRDKDGKAIEGLRADDFVVTEDGAPQTISIFQFERLEDAAPSNASEPPKPVQVLKPNQITPPPAGDPRYTNRRLLVLFFDMTSTPPPDQFRAFTAGEKFIETQMAGPDLVAIMTFSDGAIRVQKDFTDNRDQLLDTLHLLMYPPEDNNDSADIGAAFGQDAGEFNIFNTDRQLAALQTAVTMLRAVNERKSLVYFASGLRLNGIDNQAQLRATINSAIRANVAFYPVDARGLVAQAPLGDATRGSPGGIGAFSGAAASAMMSNFQRSQDSLYALAADTGGKAMLDNNDLAAGIVQAQQAITSYYVLGYYPTQYRTRRKVPSREDFSQRRSVREAGLSSGLFRRKNVQQVHRGRQGTSARRSAHAGRSDHRSHDRYGSELLSAEPRGILRSGHRENTGQ